VALGAKMDRRLDRPAVADPWFSGVVVPSYSEADAIDPTGFSIADPEATSTLPDRYGDEVGQTPGGYLAGEAGAASTEEGLGLTSMDGIWLGGQHAQRPGPLEYTGEVSPEHAWGTRGPAGRPEFGNVFQGESDAASERLSGGAASPGRKRDPRWVPRLESELVRVDEPK